MSEVYGANIPSGTRYFTTQYATYRAIGTQHDEQTASHLD